MSSQRGNVKRKPQKHQNKFAFKNDLHDKTNKTQMINNLTLGGLCLRCKEVIEWKIRYKKYKPLTVPKKCTKCQEKRVKKAYYIVCGVCSHELNICGKCGQKKELTDQIEKSESEQMSDQTQLHGELQLLPERKKRTYNRLHEQGKLTEDNLKELGVNVESDEDFDDDSDCDLEDSESDVDGQKDSSAAGGASNVTESGT